MLKRRRIRERRKRGVGPVDEGDGVKEERKECVLKKNIKEDKKKRRR